MRNSALFVVCALMAACALERPEFDMKFLPSDEKCDDVECEREDSVSDNGVDSETDSAVDDEAGHAEIDLGKDGKDSGDVVEDSGEEVANPCPEGEYPDEHVLKCLKYPCCEIAGAWMLQMVSEDAGALYSYSVSVEQGKAYLEMVIVSSAPGSIVLPDSVEGTLQEGVLHLDGGDPGISGFLLMDAKKVEQSLMQTQAIVGSYKVILNGEPTNSGQWTLTPN